MFRAGLIDSPRKGAPPRFLYPATGMVSPPLGVKISGTNFLLSWPTFAGLSYQWQYTTNLTDSWLPLGAPISGTGVTMTATNSLATAAQRFYRLMILP